MRLARHVACLHPGPCELGRLAHELVRPDEDGLAYSDVEVERPRPPAEPCAPPRRMPGPLSSSSWRSARPASGRRVLHSCATMKDAGR